MDAPPADRARRLARRHVVRLLRVQAPEDVGGVLAHLGDEGPQGEELGDDVAPTDRPLERDLRVAAHDERVGVVAVVAPAPGDGLAQVHERRDLVHGVVEPPGAEGRAVPALVPARVGDRPVERPVDEARRDRPPRAPGRRDPRARRDEEREPHDGVPRRRPVATAHDREHLLAVDGGEPPVGADEAALGRAALLGAGERVVARRRGRGRGGGRGRAGRHATTVARSPRPLR